MLIGKKQSGVTVAVVEKEYRLRWPGSLPLPREGVVMDKRTGEIFPVEPGESMADIARRRHGKESDFVMLQRNPDMKCPRCGGSGKRKAGLFSHRWKPCKCTTIPGRE